MTESIKKRLVELLLTFCMVTTGSVFVCAVYNNIFWPHDTLLNGDILWQLLALAFLCSLGNFLHPYKEISHRRAVSFVVWRLHTKETEYLNRKLREYQQAE